ncbi:uncharacterized protein MYCFIDRAFT_210606, partial [Pseudocercospora fijiensis CIRAD86]
MGDFGLAMENPHPNPAFFTPEKFDANYRPYGTPGWRAQEQTTFEPDRGVRTQPNSATDIWAIGLVIWSMIKLKLNPDNIDDWKNMQPEEQRRPSDFTQAERSRYGENLCDLIMKCLEFYPSNRATAETVLEQVERYTSGAEDEVDGIRNLPAHDRRWNKYLVKLEYDKWARGRVLMETLDDEEGELDQDVIVPPRGKRKFDERGKEYFDDDSEDSEDYGGRRGKKLREAEDSDETESDEEEDSDEDD